MGWEWAKGEYRATSFNDQRKCLRALRQYWREKPRGIVWLLGLDWMLTPGSHKLYRWVCWDRRGRSYLEQRSWRRFRWRISTDLVNIKALEARIASSLRYRRGYYSLKCKEVPMWATNWDSRVWKQEREGLWFEEEFCEWWQWRNLR